MPKKHTAKEAMIRIEQVGSPVGRNAKQRLALIGLGLNKIGRVVERAFVPAILGQVATVHHLVKVEKIES